MNLSNSKISLSSVLTPERIISKLFSFHDKAHFYHLQTDSFGKHELLDELYKDLVGHKDGIGEYLLGIQVPKRFASITMDPIEQYSEMNLVKFLEEGFTFSISLCEYAESRELEELCNMASDLQKSFVKAKLFITYR